MCFTIECSTVALWQSKCCCTFTFKRWRYIHLDRHYIEGKREVIRNNKQTWRHLQFKICSSIPLIFIKYYVDWESVICQSAKMTVTARSNQKVKKKNFIYIYLLALYTYYLHVFIVYFYYFYIFPMHQRIAQAFCAGKFVNEPRQASSCSSNFAYE